MQPEMGLRREDVGVLAELLCSESPMHEMEDCSGESVSCVQSYFDPAVLHHPQVLEQLKFLEGQTRQPRDYFHPSSNHEILPHMRKIVAMWMLEVCEEQSCEDTVFPLATAILDQFLGCTRIKAQQLQLVACVCLLLASKTRQESHFSLQLLSWYTENSVSLNTLMSWELMVLSQLNWEVNLVTPMDFVDFLLARTPSPSAIPTQKDTELIRRHAITFISMCLTEPRFATMRPSLIAAAAIYTALKGLRQEEGASATALASMAEVSVPELVAIVHCIEQVISNELAGIEQTLFERLPTIKTTMPSTPSPTQGKFGGQGHFCVGGQGHFCVGSHCSASHPLTPPDVQDVLC